MRATKFFITGAITFAAITWVGCNQQNQNGDFKDPGSSDTTQSLNTATPANSDDPNYKSYEENDPSKSATSALDSSGHSAAKTNDGTTGSKK